mgnify:CR=1 FL=1
MIDEKEVTAYVTMPDCFLQGCSEDIVIFRADGGNHFTDYGVYEGMFSGCTALTVADKLPILTDPSNVGDRALKNMFNGCTSLTAAPALPATTLASYCYYSMFYGCSSLNYIKMLATDISASRCLHYWTWGVARVGTFIKHPNMNNIPTGSSGIPKGWTVELDEL